MELPLSTSPNRGNARFCFVGTDFWSRRPGGAPGGNFKVQQKSPPRLNKSRPLLDGGIRLRQALFAALCGTKGQSPFARTQNSEKNISATNHTSGPQRGPTRRNPFRRFLLGRIKFWSRRCPRVGFNPVRTVKQRGFRFLESPLLPGPDRKTKGFYIFRVAAFARSGP